MGEDATLDDFVGGSPEAGDGDAAEDSREQDGDDSDSHDDAGAPEPARPTSRWRPGGHCDRCGEPAERRWRRGENLVCPTCSEWE